MTTLQIIPKWKDKTARFKGTIAAGEHVAVRIVNDNGEGDEYIQAEDLANLRLRVVNPANGKTLAQFPMPEVLPTVALEDEEETEGTEATEEDAETWGGPTPLTCELNLNTDRMLMAVPPGANVPLLFVLDAYEGATDEDEGEFTLYFKDLCEVTHWPRRRGEEEPTNLDDYKDIIADFREDIYGEGGFKERVENAEDAAIRARDAATESQTSAANSAIAAGNSASDAQTSAATAKDWATGGGADAGGPGAENNAKYFAQQAQAAKDDAETAQGKAEDAQASAEAAQTAAETAQGKAEDAQEAAETAQAGAESAAASAVAEVASDLSDEMTRATAAESALANNLAGAFTAATYNSTTKKIVFTKQGGTTAEIDATDFIKDGMVSSVYIGTGADAGKLVIVFNADAQKETIKIPLTQIFNPSNYYDKTSADSKFVEKENGKRLMTDAEGTKLSGIESGAKDNVVEAASASAFPQAGETGKVYVAKDENKTYRWDDDEESYVQIGGSDITVDAALSDTSTNPVQNKAVKAALDKKAAYLPYDAEVEYLQSDGQSYIVLPNSIFSTQQGSRAEITVATTGDALTATGWCPIVCAGEREWDAAYYVRLQNGYTQCGCSGLAWNNLYSDSGRHLITMINNFSGNRVLCKVDDGSARSYGLAVKDFKTTVGVFALNNGGQKCPAGVRVYGIAAYDANGAKTCDFIPVRVGTVGYLYDRVTGRLFGNAGTGGFGLGEDTWVLPSPATRPATMADIPAGASIDVVPPSTDQGDTGKAADAKATGDALAARPTKAHLDAGWWSEWTVEFYTGGEWVGVDDPRVQEEITSVSLAYDGNDGWQMTLNIVGGNERELVPSADAHNENATRLGFAILDEDDVIRATRHRVSAPVPTKPEDIGAQPAGSYVTPAQLAQKADASALRYDMGEVQIVSDYEEAEDPSPAEPIRYATAALADRTANRVTITAAIDELRLVFPSAVSGKVRDFGLRVEVGMGISSPALVVVSGFALENPDGTMPALADGTATAAGVTLLYFSETAPGVFLAKGEEVKEVL